MSAPMLGVKHPSIYRCKLGEFEITTILDGTLVRDGPHPIFGHDQSPEAVAELMRANNLPTSQFQHPFVPVLVNTGRELVLFDTGHGQMNRDKGCGQLYSLITEAGYSPGQVDVVVTTHGHPDHVGGLWEGDALAFPNARHVFGRVEFDYWTTEENVPEARKATQDLFVKQTAGLADQASFIEPDDEVVVGIRAVEAFGHSPGHLVFDIESAGQRLMILADVTNHYVASLQKPDWHVSFDHYRDQAVATRRRILGQAAADKIPVTGFHMPFPSVGYVEQWGDEFRWIPASYQLTM